MSSNQSRCQGVISTFCLGKYTLDAMVDVCVFYSHLGAMTWLHRLLKLPSFSQPPDSFRGITPLWSGHCREQWGPVVWQAFLETGSLQVLLAPSLETHHAQVHWSGGFNQPWCWPPVNVKDKTFKGHFHANNVTFNATCHCSLGAHPSSWQIPERVMGDGETSSLTSPVSPTTSGLEPLCFLPFLR